ncbi:Tn7-like element transposition protein TnsE [Thalassomonas sp. RHCl1]|uniref:Tn7-like element transposition protein TnsE n=1 Tax=Thalassomonas sp. RHCl1 TaxID=2995320 RepID=UPI00248C9CD2|nr:Tn7-like element transposition protein TnsE [Thalassomonas sp. RHCl1]
MQGIRFDTLKDNTTILSIGSFFRRVDGPLWGVNLELWPYQNKKSLSVSQLPVLARKRVLNPTVATKSAGYELHIDIENTDSWEVCSNGDCPALKDIKLSYRESSQLCFSFKSKKGISVYLPQLELGRALFFHDAYLARTALEPDALGIEFDIVSDDISDTTTVNVLQSSGYTQKSFDNYAARRVLSWILIDPDARRSYESIGRYQKLYGKEMNGYRHWDFQFEPPQLSNAKFVLRGKFDRESNSVFVYEITTISNITHKVPRKVEFYSPKFREYVRGEGSGGSGPINERPEEHNVQDGEDANSNTDHTQLYAPVVGVEFDNPFATTKIYKKKQKGSSGRKDDEANEAGKDVSTEEGDTGGNRPQADWDIAEDNSDDAHLYANKFSCFQRMLELLESECGCKITSNQIKKLPKVGRSGRHILKTDGSPRCLSVVTVICNDRQYHMLEVDTSDDSKSLSTKLLVVNKPAKWSEQLIELEQKLMKSSLSWPTEFLNLICGDKGHKSISHPQTPSENKGLLDPDSVNKWAQRVKSWMLGAQ